MMFTEKLLIVVLAVASYTYASKMCEQDDDCADLGDVFCMRSRCDWGLCGCPRGQAMRFLGSEKKFQCVPIRRVGESCSTDGDKGVCGAENSECIDGKCICDHSDTVGITKRWSYWGGELCEVQSQSIGGETCSNSLGNCNADGSNSDGCTESSDWWTGSLQSLPNTCGCPQRQRVALVNDFEDHDFTGNYIPKCVPIKYNEMCLQIGDCPGNMDCVNNKCACATVGHAPDFNGINCNVRLGKNAVCSGVAGNCDGREGLVCGDVCDVKNYNDPTVNKRCVCDPSYAESGGSCTKATESTSCDRDYQCKSLSRTAVCVDEICKAGSAGVYVSLFLMLGVIVLNRVFLS